jgi:hypothetical protein
MRLNEPELRPKLRPMHDQRIVRRDNQRGAGTSVEPIHRIAAMLAVSPSL